MPIMQRFYVEVLFAFIYHLLDTKLYLLCVSGVKNKGHNALGS